MSDKVKHPWRPCPMGEHWVREHLRHVTISDLNPQGTTRVEGHCRINPSRHEIFLADEIHKIAAEFFKNLKFLPKLDDLDFPNGNKFDELIAGWTQFWNEVFQPKEPLDPNLVKALIATESGFKTESSAKSKDGTAQGLVQITEGSRKILGNSRGELKDYLIDLTKKEITDPNVNICTSIRWLFYKRALASHRLKREATWEEAVAEYKGILGQLGKIEEADRIMRDLENYYTRLRKK